MEKQTCLKAYALPAIEEPLEIIIEDSYSALSLTRPEVPMMTRAEEGLHCFWEEDTGLEVLLVQVLGSLCDVVINVLVLLHVVSPPAVAVFDTLV